MLRYITWVAAVSMMLEGGQGWTTASCSTNSACAAPLQCQHVFPPEGRGLCERGKLQCFKLCNSYGCTKSSF